MGTGVSRHANTPIRAPRVDQLEQLTRYTARGAVALQRPQADANGDLVYTFTHPWPDGTTGIRLSPLELLEKLAALVPLPPHASGALWGVPGAAQPPARGHHPHAPPAREGGRGGDGHQITALELGTTAEAGVCAGHGALSLVSTGGAADYRGHYAGRGDPEAPQASEARGGPTPHCSRVCPSGSLCMVFGLSMPRASSTRLQVLPWG